MANTDPSESIAAAVSESVKVSDVVESQLRPVQGLIAILDALGTKLLSVSEAVEFVRLRDSTLRFATSIIETHLPGIEIARLKTLILNDTVVYAFEAPNGVTLVEVEQFCHLLRVAEARSIVEGFPFRGAFAVGEFFIGDAQTVLGPAVNDAASWFEGADWLGVHATPHATLYIQSLLDKADAAGQIDHVLVDYSVPIKSPRSDLPKLKAVNWPKGFYLKGVRPQGGGSTRALVLSALTARRIPRETESKYFNTVKFFDDVQVSQTLEERFGRVPALKVSVSG